MKALPSELARYFANVDYRRRLAIVAEPPAREADVLVGVARLEPTDTPTMAELALVVEDAWQRMGLGAILLAHILSRAMKHPKNDAAVRSTPAWGSARPCWGDGLGGHGFSVTSAGPVSSQRVAWRSVR
jgi:GNAT superfamily N-acetyltransferase